MLSGQAGQFDHKRGLRTANQRWGWGDYFYIYIANPPYNSFGKWKWSIWMYFPGIVSDLLNSGSFHAQLGGSPLYHSLSVIRGDWILSFLQLQRQCVFTLSCFQMNLLFHTQHVFRKLSWLSSMIFTESPFFCLLLQHLTNIPNLFFLQIQLAATLIFSRTWWGR